MSLSEAEAADVHAVSARLAERRAPAFYFEYDEEPAGARRAAADARRIQRLCAPHRYGHRTAGLRFGREQPPLTGSRLRAQPISAPLCHLRRRRHHPPYCPSLPAEGRIRIAGGATVLNAAQASTGMAWHGLAWPCMAVMAIERRSRGE